VANLISNGSHKLHFLTTNETNDASGIHQVGRITGATGCIWLMNNLIGCFKNQADASQKDRKTTTHVKEAEA